MYSPRAGRRRCLGSKPAVSQVLGQCLGLPSSPPVGSVAIPCGRLADRRGWGGYGVEHGSRAGSTSGAGAGPDGRRGNGELGGCHGRRVGAVQAQSLADAGSPGEPAVGGLAVPPGRGRSGVDTSAHRASACPGPADALQPLRADRAHGPRPGVQAEPVGAGAVDVPRVLGGLPAVPSGYRGSLAVVVAVEVDVSVSGPRGVSGRPVSEVPLAAVLAAGLVEGPSADPLHAAGERLGRAAASWRDAGVRLPDGGAICRAGRGRGRRPPAAPDRCSARAGRRGGERRLPGGAAALGGHGPRRGPAGPPLARDHDGVGRGRGGLRQAGSRAAHGTVVGPGARCADGDIGAGTDCRTRPGGAECTATSKRPRWPRRCRRPSPSASRAGRASRRRIRAWGPRSACTSGRSSRWRRSGSSVRG